MVSTSTCFITGMPSSGSLHICVPFHLVDALKMELRCPNM